MSGYDTKKANMTKQTNSKWEGAADCTLASGAYTCTNFTGGFTGAVGKMKGICVES